MIATTARPRRPCPSALHRRFVITEWAPDLPHRETRLRISRFQADQPLDTRDPTSQSRHTIHNLLRVQPRVQTLPAARARQTKLRLVAKSRRIPGMLQDALLLTCRR